MNEKVFINAVKAQAKGYNLIPLRGGEVDSPDFKKPLIPWEKYQQQRSTVSEVRKWLTQQPELVFGIVTGPISNLVVVDYDTECVELIDPTPGMPLIKTRRGWHAYYQWNFALNNKSTTRTKIAENVDVRGEGGYVVAWQLADLLETSKLPFVSNEILALLPDKEKITQADSNKNWLGDAFAGLREGNRNDTFTRVAGSLRSRGYSFDDIFSFLGPKAREVGFDENELKSVCDSVCRYAPKIIINSDSAKISDFLSTTETYDWIVPEVIAKETLGFVCGLPESRKTWLLMDLALEMAKGGGEWLGRFKVNGGKVLFIDQERAKKETQRRFRSLLKAKGLTHKDLDGTLHVKSGSTIRLDLQHSFDAFRKELLDYKPDLVLIDSFATFHTLEENSRSEIQKVLERIKELRSEIGCTFLFIDHENKGAFQNSKAHEEERNVSFDKQVGSIAKAAAAETIFTVRHKDDASSIVYHTKSTVSEKIEPILVKVENLKDDRSEVVVRAY